MNAGAAGRIACSVPPDLIYRGDPSALPASTLGAVLYARDARARCQGLGDPRLVPVELDAIGSGTHVETWLTRGPVHYGECDGVRYAASAEHLFGVIELDESVHGGPRGAGREAYRRLGQFHGRGEHGHVWRIWNFIDAINEGEGDDERYRQFCIGRAEGIGATATGYPAASALGRRDGARILQVIWIAGRTPPGRVENPRQMSAFRYPRQYGPAAPSFSRAARIGDRLLISGTASIVGHESRHDGDVRAQTTESLENLCAVAEAAGLDRAGLAGIKAYVRYAADVEAVSEELDRHGYAADARCVLLADICRRDLLVEFEAIVVD